MAVGSIPTEGVYLFFFSSKFGYWFQGKLSGNENISSFDDVVFNLELSDCSHGLVGYDVRLTRGRS